MSEWRSAAIDAAMNGLVKYGEDLDVPREVPLAAALLGEMRRSGRQFFFSKPLLEVGGFYPTPEHFRAWLSALATTDIGREYLAIGFAWEGLDRAEAAVTRFEQVLSVLPSTDPPERSLDRLRAAASMYVSGFDVGCIVMCRA